MDRILHDVPIEAGVVGPLADLAELAAHEHQFFAGLGVHVGEKQTQVGEFLPFVAGHFADQRSFAVNHFVVRERQHEILLERIQHAEGELAVVILAMDGIVLEILERVVHPSHVPLHAEAEAADDRPVLKPWARKWILRRRFESRDVLCRLPD